MNNNLPVDMLRGVMYKSFNRVGSTMVDVKGCVGYSFVKARNGYIAVQFIYPTGLTMNAPLKDRNEFYQFLIEMEDFIDRKELMMPELRKFVNEIEQEILFSDENKGKTLYVNNQETDTIDGYPDDEDDED